MKKKLLTLAAIALTIFALLMTGCTPQVFSNNSFLSDNRVKREADETLSLDLGEAKNLDIDNQTGNIIVKKTSDTNVTVKSWYKVDGQVQEEVEKVISEMKTFAEVKDGKLKVRAVCSDGTDFWQWKQDHYRMLNANITFEVSLPKDLDNYKLRMITGNITLEGLNGCMDAEDITGNITLNDVKLAGSNNLQLITGNVELNAASLSDAEAVTIMNTTGNITASLPSDSSMKLTASIVTGNMSGSLAGNTVKSLAGASIDKTYGDGKTKVFMKLITGNITISKR